MEKKEVSDDDVEQTIQSLLLSSGKTDGLTKDGAAEDGDWVNIDYSGSVDGTAFDGGTSTGYDLQLSSRIRIRTIQTCPVNRQISTLS